MAKLSLFLMQEIPKKFHLAKVIRWLKSLNPSTILTLFWNILNTMIQDKKTMTSTIIQFKI